MTSYVWRRGTALWVLGFAALALADVPRHSVVEITFPTETIKAVRLVILSSQGGGQPCVDELEIYGPASRENLALGGQASASSCLPGYAVHQVAHLNDGQYGNAHSWISNEPGTGWAQIDLAAPAEVDRVVYSRDRLGQYRDRKAQEIEIHVLDTQGPVAQSGCRHFRQRGSRCFAESAAPPPWKSRK